MADEQRASHGAKGVDVGRIDRQRPAERGHPLRILADGDQRGAQLAPRAGRTRPELYRAPQTRQGAIVQLQHGHVIGFGRAELDVRARIREIQRYGSFEQDDGAVQRFETLGAAVDQPARERLVRAYHPGLRARAPASSLSGHAISAHPWQPSLSKRPVRTL